MDLRIFHCGVTLNEKGTNWRCADWGIHQFVDVPISGFVTPKTLFGDLPDNLLVNRFARYGYSNQ